jgi:hypothetical protein
MLARAAVGLECTAGALMGENGRQNLEGEEKELLTIFEQLNPPEAAALLHLARVMIAP